mmetsp:Transcript_109115/g.314302  ORF Transcript_109115/g.314302 Transcript_109115/m.314302 type:complete len:414 (-) Transcript_109115:28-1269(-)|eukprot:CAMPEP_0170260580 /NCGR_PEP_ID=MMETSP0116_2-20130129/30167_1 /TAXON_ID=400756 /ORGANISM="Durinskia baltica, Strain CSIRO CS-38" /LENGTH=413 /DNA_ID=CAMNT_0010511637 /DNA_START=61 /DNA_END=1302 /DNA_ORIENTATION=+
MGNSLGCCDSGALGVHATLVGVQDVSDDSKIKHPFFSELDTDAITSTGVAGDSGGLDMSPDSSPQLTPTADELPPPETSSSDNVFNGMEPEVVVPDALERATRCMEPEDMDILAAEAVLAQAVDRLQACGAAEALARLEESDVYQTVSMRISHFNAAVDNIYGKDMEVFFESENSRFDAHVSPDGRWFEYRMTVDVDAPLAEALATGQEQDLVHKAQPLVSSAEFIGESNPFDIKFIWRLPVVIFRVELVLEIIRHRNRDFGYLLEIARTEFSQDGLTMPKRGFGAIRPWINHTTLWIPRGGGSNGTTVVQLSRVDCTMAVPKWILHFLLRNMATTFVNDLRNTAEMASKPGSLWKERIERDACALYGKLREVERAAAGRSEVRFDSVPGRQVFDRRWRLNVPRIDTRPPSAR